jgi:hypothetical protein
MASNYGSTGILDHDTIQDGIYLNLGDPLYSYGSEYLKTSCKKQGLRKDAMEVGLIHSTLSMGKPYTWGRGQQYGKDEWHQEKHNVKPRRSWKKLHLVVDDNNIIQGVELAEKSVHDSEVASDLLDQVQGLGDRYIADGAYDTKKVYEEIERQNENAKIVISPRENAVISDEWHAERNKTLDIIDKHGYKGWYKIRKYGFQNYAELSMQRYKKIIGPKMHSRDIRRQKNEAVIATSILNKFTTLGMPISKKVA